MTLVTMMKKLEIKLILKELGLSDHLYITRKKGKCSLISSNRLERSLSRFTYIEAYFYFLLLL